MLNYQRVYTSRSTENCPLGWWLMRVRISMFFCTSLFCFISVLFFPSSFSLVHFVYTFSLCFLFFVVLSFYQSFHFFRSFVLLFFRSFTRSFMLFIYSSFLCSLVLFFFTFFFPCLIASCLPAFLPYLLRCFLSFFTLSFLSFLLFFFGNLGILWECLLGFTPIKKKIRKVLSATKKKRLVICFHSHSQFRQWRVLEYIISTMFLSFSIVVLLNVQQLLLYTVIDTCFWLVGLNKSQQTIGVHSSNQISQHIRSSRSPPPKKKRKKQHCGRNPIGRLPKSGFTRFSKEGGGPADIAEGESDQVKNIALLWWSLCTIYVQIYTPHASCKREI